MAIEASHYEETRQRLVNDPIVIAMAAEINQEPEREKIIASFIHEKGSPTFDFMQMANREYARRGGTGDAHLGAVAQALLRLLDG